MAPQRRPGLDLLTTPVFVAAVAVLVINDHVLKQRWPGIVTGKLSDVAGVAMMAMLLTALLRRRWLGFALTIVGFGALKTFEPVAQWAAPVLGGVTLTDRTDLVALLVVVPLWKWASRASEPREAARSGWRMAAQVLAISAAALATSATSCAEDGVYSVSVGADGALLADSTDGTFASMDGGASWSASDAVVEFGGDRRRSCLGDGTCFEVEGSSVIREVDGERSVDIEMTQAQLNDLVQHSGSSCGGEGQYFGSVAAVDTPDGGHVVVSMSGEGVLRRTPDGAWRWAPVGPYGVDAALGAPGAPTEPPIVDTTVSASATAASWALGLTPLVVALSAILLGRRARGSSLGVLTTVTVTMGLALLILSWVGVVFILTDANQDGAALVVCALVAAAAAAAGLAGIAAMSKRRSLPSPGGADWAPPRAH